MRAKTIFVLLMLSGQALFLPPQSDRFDPMPAKEFVEQVWNRARRGELLTPEGWRRTAALYSEPAPFPRNSVVLIYSDDYGVNDSSVDGTSAVVDMECVDLGQIDSALRYTPPAPTAA